MKFSVLMSVYKQDTPDHFVQALESVTLNQTVAPAQVVIVQDGPVPAEIGLLIEAVRVRADQIEFTVISKAQNGGLAAALNTGFSACQYDWIARMDSDDISAPDRFEKQLSYLQSHPDVDVLGGAVAEFNHTPEELLSIRRVGRTHCEIVHMAKSRSPMNHPTIFYRKEAVEKVGGYSENFGKLEDYKLWVDLILSGAQLANLNDILVFFRIGDDFIHRRSSRSEIADWDKLQTFLRNAGLISLGRAIMNQACIRAFIYMSPWLKKIIYQTLLRK